MDFNFSKLLSQLPPEVMTELEEVQKKTDELDRADAQVCSGARPAPMETVPGGASERGTALYGARVHSEEPVRHAVHVDAPFACVELGLCGL